MTVPRGPDGNRPAQELRFRGVIATAASLLVSRGSALLLGAIAWLVATRAFSVEVIGQNAAIVGTCTFIATAALLGLDQTVVRFGSGADKTSRGQLIQAAMVVSPAVAFAVALVAAAVALVPNSAGSSALAASMWIGVPVAAAAATATYMGEAALLAVGRPGAIVGTNVAVSVARLAVLGVLAWAQAPIYLAYLCSWLLGFGLVAQFARGHVTVSRPDVISGATRLWTHASYSLANYLATTLDVAAVSLLPLVILQLSGAATAGVFQIVWLIATSLYVLPSSFGIAVFAHASRGTLSERPKRLIQIASLGGMSVLSLCVVVAAPLILAAVGPEYVMGASLLAWFAATIPVVAFNTLRQADIKVTGRLRWLVAASLAHLVVLLTLLGLLLPGNGLDVIGASWFLSQLLLAFVVSMPMAAQHLNHARPRHLEVGTLASRTASLEAEPRTVE